MSPSNPALLTDLATFARAQLDSQDMDPVYPVLRYLIEHYTTGEEEGLWLLLLYVAYYNLPSAWTAFQVLDTPEQAACGVPEAILRLPCGTERRGHRDPGKLLFHLYALRNQALNHGGLKAWLQSVWSQDPALDWDLVQLSIQDAYGNGRWAAYKTAELLQKVLDWPLLPTDMGNAFSTGPRQGLALFFGKVEGNSPQAIKQLDTQGNLIQAFLHDSSGLDIDIAQVETALCDFHALHDGRYYVGHDIDQLLEQIVKSPATDGSVNDILLARSRTLPHAYLGELHDWRGVDRARKRVYKEQGIVCTRTP